jgi:hypothetical protein
MNDLFPWPKYESRRFGSVTLDAQANSVFSYWFIALTACVVCKQTIPPLLQILGLHLLRKWDSSKEGFRTSPIWSCVAGSNGSRLTHGHKVTLQHTSFLSPRPRKCWPNLRSRSRNVRDILKNLKCQFYLIIRAHTKWGKTWLKL